MKTYFLSIFVFVVLALNGQIDTTKTLKNQIKISPHKLITYLRGLEFSYERQYFKKHSTQFSYMYIFDPFAKTEFATLKNLNGFSLGIEQKYFLNKIRNTRNYFSIDYNISNYSFEDVAWFGYENPQDSVQQAYQYLDTFNIKKTTHTTCLRWGLQVVIKHFVFDLNIGIGICYRIVSHSNRINSSDYMEMPRHPNFGYEQTVNGAYFVPSLPIGLKLGYVF